ncbi:MAG: 4-(cytidine 5'-diphospho)-2-C-methyl-D-erythritol kinase [Pseudomonadota bacterium]
MRLLSPAKINLFLYVTGKREDGYHDLYTLMCPVSLQDIVELDFSAAAVCVRCVHPDVPENETNLAHRAAKLFFKCLGASRGNLPQGVEISITKKIPVAAGLGGGSSNAATVLTGMNRHFSTPFSTDDLERMGLTIGADVPFFIQGKPAVATGVGEVLAPVECLPAFYVLLVNPGVPVSTAEVYKNLNLGLTNNPKINKEPFFRVRNIDPVRYLWNDLEKVTASKFPVIQTIKEALLANGAEGALMTGSGPTVFGLFYDVKKARQASHVLSRHENWRVFLAEAIRE